MAYAFALYELYFVIHSALLILQRINASSSSSGRRFSRSCVASMAVFGPSPSACPWF